MRVLGAFAHQVARLAAGEAHGELEVGVGQLAVARGVLLAAAVVARLGAARAAVRAALLQAAVAQGVARASAPEADQLAVVVDRAEREAVVRRVSILAFRIRGEMWTPKKHGVQRRNRSLLSGKAQW